VTRASASRTNRLLFERFTQLEAESTAASPASASDSRPRGIRRDDGRLDRRRSAPGGSVLVHRAVPEDRARPPADRVVDLDSAVLLIDHQPTSCRSSRTTSAHREMRVDHATSGADAIAALPRASVRIAW
jgi:hypothetical protein